MLVTPSKAANSRAALIVILVLYVIVYARTVPEKTGDTPVYADDILRYFQGGSGIGPSVIWEFGHLLWRPAGYVLWLSTRSFLSSWSGGNGIIEITAVLFAINFAAGLALVLLTFAVCSWLGVGRKAALLIAVAVMLCSSILNYFHSGASYNPGLAAHMAGILFILESFIARRRARVYAALGGACLSLSCAVWFPYVLSIPAALLMAWFAAARVAPGDRMRLLSIAILSAAFSGLVLFGLGAAAGHISSYSALMHWISNSSHGVQQNRQLIRFPAGFTRSFLYLGDDGLLIKRFVFGDPYAPVLWYSLLGASLWKVCLVFATFGVLVWSLARYRESWPALAVVIVGCVPTLLFALELFETSEPARYEPLYPALIVGVCSALLLKNSRAVLPLLTVFLIAMAVVNLKAYAWDLRGVASASSARARLVEAHTRHGGVAFLLSFRDPLSTYVQSSPFVAENRQHALPLFHVIEPGARHIAIWRQESACRVLDAWKAGGDAWLSTRLMANVPLPEWNWAEHDDNRIHWVDLPAFFTRLDTDDRLGAGDGFLRVARTGKNQAFLEAACGAVQ